MTKTQPTFADQLKAKAEEYQVERRLTEFADQADVYLRKAVAKAGELAHDNRDKVEDLLDKGAAAVDSKTHGKYSSQVAKVKSTVATGVSKLAEQRPSATPEEPKATGYAGDGTSAVPPTSATDAPSTPAE